MDAKPPTSPEFKRFNALVGKVLSVPKSEIVKREAEYKRKSEATPKRRGPKSKNSNLPA
jgi:hypothetical protein